MGSSDAGNLLRYGEARSSSTKPGRCSSRAGAAVAIDAASTAASEIATCAVGIPTRWATTAEEYSQGSRNAELGRPAFADLFHFRQHRRRRQSTEQLPVPEHGRLVGRDDGEAFPDRRHERLRWLASGLEGEAGELNHLPQRRRPHDQGLGPTPPRRPEERQHRIQMPRPTERTGRQQPHEAEDTTNAAALCRR